MKKSTIAITSFVAGCMVMGSVGAIAAQPTLKAIQAQLNSNLKIKYQGQDQQLSNTPISYNNTTYLPLRETADMLGLFTNFDQKTQTISIVEGASETVDSQAIETQLPSEHQSEYERLPDYIPSSLTPAIRVHGEVYLSLRDGADKYDLYHEVTYDAKSNSVTFEKIDYRVVLDESNSVYVDGMRFIKESIFISAMAQFEQIK